MDKINITKQEAVDLYGSQAELARALGVGRAAVCHWDWDKPIPQKHALVIRYVLRPEAFENHQVA